MSTRTGIKMWEMRELRGGSSVFGNCELCGEHADVLYMRIDKQEMVDENRVKTMQQTGSSVYAHNHCLTEIFGKPDVVTVLSVIAD